MQDFSKWINLHLSLTGWAGANHKACQSGVSCFTSEVVVYSDRHVSYTYYAILG